MKAGIAEQNGRIDPTSEVVKTAPVGAINTSRSLATSRSLSRQEQPNG